MAQQPYKITVILSEAKPGDDGYFATVDVTALFLDSKGRAVRLFGAIGTILDVVKLESAEAKLKVQQRVGKALQALQDDDDEESR